jgi:uncharacterized protein (DUF2062 family)
MFGVLRQFARLLTGQAHAFEIGLGVFFGVLLALTPARTVDPGSGFFSFNALWLIALFLFLALRASIPIALLLIGFFELLEALFLGRLTSGAGRFLLEDALPESFAVGLARAWPAAQLHTWWGCGGFLCGLILGVALAFPLHLWVQRRLPAWREKYGRSRLVNVVGGAWYARLLGGWLG